MSLQRGLAALRLEAGDRVARTEYSAETHWPLVSRVTGIAVNEHSPEAERRRATDAFRRAWDYDLVWSIYLTTQPFGEKRTKMGHAQYAAGGVDFSRETQQLFDDPQDVYGYDLIEAYGVPSHAEAVAAFDAHYGQNCLRTPDAVNMTGIYTTMMSGLIELLGWDTLLMAAGLDPRAFGAFVDRYAQWILPYFRALADCRAQTVMIHDDFVWGNGKFLSADLYRAHFFPNYKRLFDPLREAGKTILFTSDGDYTEFIDDVAACGINAFVLEPVTDMAAIAERYGATHAFIGNADTTILLHGTREDIRREVARCMAIGKQYPGFFMAVGNHIPSNTPVENALYYQECVLEMGRR